MASKLFSEDQLLELIDLYAAGNSCRQIAEKYGCSDSTVKKLLPRLGVQMRPSKSPGPQQIGLRKERRFIKEDQEADVIAEYVEGLTLEEIAEHYHCGRKAIIGVLKRSETPLRPGAGGPRRVFTDDETVRILQMWESGESLHAIAINVGSYVGRMRKYIQSLGHQTETRYRPIRGESHYAWNGGRYISNGYMIVSISADDPMFSMTRDRGRVGEHRLVMARDIGRPLLESETVHHIDGDKLNNDIANLQLRNGNHGKGFAHACLDCGSNNIKSVPIANPED